MNAFIKREWYMLAIIGMVVLAALLPIGGQPAVLFDSATHIAIAALFFLHGARLSRDVVIAGLVHWRLHLLVLAITFVIFPLLGLMLLALPQFMAPLLVTGIIFLCVLPSTVQSSIAFTSIAGGNVPAAVCSASASNILGMFLTPLLLGLIFQTRGQGLPLDSMRDILLQLLAPFVAGQLLQGWIGGWIRRQKLLMQIVDRGSILMVVYAAFSAAIIQGLWSRLSLGDLVAVVVVDAVLLAIVLVLSSLLSKAFGFNRADRITILFCGSKKTLAAGAPMANVIFPPSDVGVILIPLMVFHQIQLIVCAWLARRFAG